MEEFRVAELQRGAEAQGFARRRQNVLFSAALRPLRLCVENHSSKNPRRCHSLGTDGRHSMTVVGRKAGPPLADARIRMTSFYASATGNRMIRRCASVSVFQTARGMLLTSRLSSAFQRRT